MEFGTTLSRADDESSEAGGDSVRCTCASLRPRRRASPTPGPHRRPSATPSRLANGAGPCRRRPLPSPSRTSSRRLPSPPLRFARCRRSPATAPAPPRAATPALRAEPPSFASCSRPTSVGLARVALVVALLEPSGERETKRTIGRGATRRDKKEGSGKEKERKKERKRQNRNKKINKIRL
jgi:hypothetical protein